MIKTAAIGFFLPEPDLSNLPQNIGDYWYWQTTATDIFPWWGRYHWVLQTYLFLRKAGYHTELINEISYDGIVITHRDLLPNDYRPHAQQYLVCLLVDRLKPHPYAPFHIVHNRRQLQQVGSAAFMQPWIQVDLLPRLPSRGERFENVGFFGYPITLASDFSTPQFTQPLADLGLRLQKPEPQHWNDFSRTDAILAIRTIGYTDSHDCKPALKLLNAWAAGVPAVLGYESGYRQVRTSNLDYLEATDIASALAALSILRDNIAMRQTMVANGLRRANSFGHEKNLAQWLRLLEGTIIPNYRAWCESATVRKAFLARCSIRNHRHELTKQLGRLASSLRSLRA